MKCRHGVVGDCPACEALAEERADPGRDDFTADEWDRLEAGPLWNTYPGMGSA